MYPLILYLLQYTVGKKQYWKDMQESSVFRKYAPGSSEPSSQSQQSSFTLSKGIVREPSRQVNGLPSSQNCRSCRDEQKKRVSAMTAFFRTFSNAKYFTLAVVTYDSVLVGVAFNHKCLLDRGTPRGRWTSTAETPRLRSSRRRYWQDIMMVQLRTGSEFNKTPLQQKLLYTTQNVQMNNASTV